MNSQIVVFEIGGSSHLRNAYLANCFKTTDLLNDVKYDLNKANYEELCSNTCEKVLDIFNNKVVANRYMKLHKEVPNG
ncbi:MAG TPA: hypothetical protein ENK99_02500 [Campylobacterales bacterium]|nr:hypothetical protein [Campylobacterales bacterium]